LVDQNTNPLALLLRSRKFWLAVVALIQTLVFQFLPQFPAEVWQSINVVIGVVIAAIAVEDAADKIGNGIGAGIASTSGATEAPAE
jgi:uncharacterized membrane-anchored protein